MSVNPGSLFYPFVLFFMQVAPVDENSSAYQAGKWSARVFIAVVAVVVVYTLYKWRGGRK